jgi:hypothetical protein
MSGGLTPAIAPVLGVLAALGDPPREVTARRELYRRCSRIGESAVDMAQRVIYAVVKES